MTGSGGVRAFVARQGELLDRILSIPIAFLGVGVYRAWLATFFRFGAYPSLGFSDYALFEIVIGLTCLVTAARAGRIAPLWSNRRALRLAGGCCVGGALACIVEQVLLPCATLRVVGLALAGIGLALLILVWCEFYGSLNPMRVAVYHAISIAFGEVLIWLMMGMRASYVMVFSVLLPLLCVRWARRAALALPEQDRPRAVEQGRMQGLPWKPILLMAACTFATGYGMLPGQPFSFGEVIGVTGSAIFVALGSLSPSRRFNFDTIYRVAFPFMTAALLLVPPLVGGMPQLSGLCFGAGYTMLTMFIMIILSNITFRFGINAVWLNGIERGIRYLVEAIGWCAYLTTSDVLGVRAAAIAQGAVTVVVVVLFLLITLSEKSLGARWGIDLHDQGEPIGSADILDVGMLSQRVSDLSERCGLTDREQEVLQLIARKVPTEKMEHDLFLARGTIKAHTDHIYRKLGVHSREELYKMLGISENV